MKEPGALERTVWHQDLAYFHVDGDQLCTTWCPLDPTDAENGAVRYARGSHRWDARVPAEPVREHDADPGDRGRARPRRRCARRGRRRRGAHVRHRARATSSCTTRARCTRPAATGPRRPGAGRSRSATAATTPGCWSAPAPRSSPTSTASPTARCSTPPTAPSSGAPGHVEPVPVPRYPGGHGRARLPDLRRRQPLLRGARRLHPAPRPEGRAADGAVGRDQRPAVPRGRRAGQPRGGEPDVQPDRQGRRDARLLPRQPGGTQPARVPARSASRSGPSTATATPGSASWTSRASTRSGCSRRSACSTRSCSIDDPEAVTLTFTAFNRWLEEDWGFAYQDRIFAAPYLSLCDVDWAVRELEWALDRGARVIVMRPAAVFTETGPRTPADPMFDPFWARVNEAGITVVVHAGDSGYTSHGYAKDGFSAAFGDGARRPSIKILTMERAIYDFLASLVFDQLFERFPNVRIASVENGSEFLARPVQEAALVAPQDPGLLPRGPGRDLPAQRVDQPVLGGRRLRDRRAHGRRPGDLRLGLAAHRGHARAARLRQGAQGLRRRRPRS